MSMAEPDRATQLASAVADYYALMPGDTDAAWPRMTADYQAGHPESFTNAQQINAAQQLAAHFALNDATYTQPAAAVGFSVEGFTGLSVSWTASESPYVPISYLVEVDGRFDGNTRDLFLTSRSD